MTQPAIVGMSTSPDLNESRRNHAGAFVPMGDGTDGQPGMWIWGGIQEDDSAVLTVPEFYNVTPLGDFTLIPRDKFVWGTGIVTLDLGASNRSGADDTFDLSYSGSQTWTVTGPPTVTVADGDQVAFSLDVIVPDNAGCLTQNIITIDGAGQTNTTLTDTIQATVQVYCDTGVGGIIYDANTSLPLENAYIYLEDITDDDNTEEAFSDSSGNYVITNVLPGEYYLAVSAQGYQFSILPSGWPTGAHHITITEGLLETQDETLLAPMMDWAAPDLSATLGSNEQITYTLTITNDGTSDLFFSWGNYNGDVDPPPLTPHAMPDYRVDPRIMADLNRSTSGTADFIVVMKEQADLSAAFGMTDWNARGQYVYETLSVTVARSQAGIRTQLDASGLAYRPFISINGLLVKNGGFEAVYEMAERQDVAYLMANDVIPLETTSPTFWQRITAKARQLLAPDTLTWGVTAVNADDVWQTGVLGENIIVANIDTGVEWTHEALQAQYRGGADDHDYNWYMPTSGCAGELEPCDNDGHGSHTMGTMVGSTHPTTPLTATEGIGVAPGAEWIACKGCESNSCSFEALLACGDWMVAPTDLNGENPDPSQRPHIINNSWGGDGGDFWYGGVVGAWRASGMFPQFSAGNSGPNCSTTGSPGDYWSSFNSAALDNTLNAAGFSSRGPAAVTGMLKPNISAPGVAVRSSIPGNTYENYNGTSMASPHVAGVAALIWSAQPELIGQIEDTMWLLSQTSDPLLTTDGCGGDTPTDHPNNTFGWGIVDAMTAVSNTDGIVVSWVETVPAGGVVPPDSTMTVDVIFTAPNTPGYYTGTLQLTADEPYNPEVLFPLALMVNPLTPTASFESNSPVILGEEAIFTNTSTGTEPITYLWDFGDTMTNTMENPTHVYSETGTFTVTLIATNAYGSSEVTALFVVEDEMMEIYLPIIMKPTE